MTTTTITRSGHISTSTQGSTASERRGRRLSGLLSLLAPVPRARPARTASRRHLLLERLEERTVLSGFGPEDGAYIVEDALSASYGSVKIIAGDQIVASTGHGNGVARYDAGGTLDTSFGSGGFAMLPIGGSGTTGLDSLAIQGDGKLVIAGTCGVGAGLAVGRLTADGNPDTTFGTDGKSECLAIPESSPGTSSHRGHAAALQSTGKIVAVGTSATGILTGDSSTRAVVARFTAAGALDTQGKSGFGDFAKGTTTGYVLSTFGGQSQYFNDVKVQGDDKIVAVGVVNYGGPTANTALVIARYTVNGTLDASFNGTGYHVFRPDGWDVAWARNVTLQPDGKIVVLGRASGVDGFSDLLVARFNANGTLDNTFGGGSGYARFDVDGTASVTSEQGQGLVLQPDGKIVAAGLLTAIHADGTVGVRNSLVVRFNPDGTPDTGFGTGGFKLGPAPEGRRSAGSAVALQSDGTIIVGGNHNVLTGASNSHPMLWRFYGDNDSPPPGGEDPPPAATIPLAPSNLTAVAASKTLIHLAWTDNSDNESGFYIERSGNGGKSWSQIATVGANTTTYAASVPASKTYSYSFRVRAFNDAGASDYSNEATPTATTSTATTSTTTTSTATADETDAALLSLLYEDASPTKRRK